MLESFIALLGITSGIISLNLFALIRPEYSLGLTGNTLIGVFGSVFFVKIFSHLGFAPQTVITESTINLFLLFIYESVSVFGSIVFLFLTQYVLNKIQKKEGSF